MSKHKKPQQETEPAEMKPEAEKAAAEEEVTAEQEAPAPETDPAAELQSIISKLEDDLKEAKNDVARAYADADNTRKRLVKQAEADRKYRFQQAALELLPVLDSMNLALANAPQSEETQNFVKGFEMIRTKLEDVLDKEGVKEIDAEGKPFDAATMQAVMQEPAEGVEPGTVTQVLQTGYMLKDRMLRPAMVKVSA